MTFVFMLGRDVLSAIFASSLLLSQHICYGHWKHRTYALSKVNYFSNDTGLWSFRCEQPSVLSCAFRCDALSDTCTSFAYIFNEDLKQPGLCILHSCNSYVHSERDLVPGSRSLFYTSLSHQQTDCSSVPDITEDENFTLSQETYQDCLDILVVGGIHESGVYAIRLNDSTFAEVYCDMETDGGGWTVFQRRRDGSVDFYRNWSDYLEGFGTPLGEFWLGNEAISLLTPTSANELRIDMEDFENITTFAYYDTFQVGNAESLFQLSIGPLRAGDAGDSMRYHHNSLFSTKDTPENDNLTKSCALLYKGGWWYNKCHTANLNGLYLNGYHRSYADGIEWNSWHGYYYSLKFTEMKLRRIFSNT